MSDPEILFPTNRNYLQDPSYCNKKVDGCRSVQIRNIPDLTIEKVFSNPGCNHNFIDCPNTVEWEDKGKSGITNRCCAVTGDSTLFGAAIKDNCTNARMRVCKRVINGNTPQTDFKIMDLCKIRRVLSFIDPDFSNGKNPNCTPNQGNNFTCGEPWEETNQLGGITFNTNLPIQYAQEVKYPIQLFDGAFNSDVLANFSEGDIHQYGTCNATLWNIDNNSIDFLTNYFKTTANYSLPTRGNLEADGITTPEAIDNGFLTGFWLSSYGLSESPSNVLGEKYNGLIENGYPGGLEIVHLIANTLNETAQANFIDQFTLNARTILNQTEYLIDSTLFPNIKRAINILCDASRLRSDGLTQCSNFYKDICNNISKADIVGENQEELRYMCSCNMNINEYNIPAADGSSVPQQDPITCDTTCLSGNGFPNIVNGEITVCNSTFCIISGIDITVIDSNVEGGINVSNLCSDDCGDGGCVCYMNDISVTTLNSTISGGVNISQSCGTCYELIDNNYNNVREVSCDNGELLEGQSSSLTSFSKKVSDNRYWILPLFATLFAVALLFALIVLFWYRKPKKVSQEISLPSEVDYDFTKSAPVEIPQTLPQQPGFSQGPPPNQVYNFGNKQEIPQ